MLKKLFFSLLILLTLLPITCIQSTQNDDAHMEEIPTSYKGRFRPLNAAARLWLEDYYHHQSIKASQRHAFHVVNSSALSLLWKIQFCGYQNWSDAPFFWIYSSDLKKLLNLQLDTNYFSYNDLKNAIYENKQTNHAVVKELINYEFLKAYYSGSNRSGNNQFELSQLSPDLWVAIKNNHITVITAPKNKPWNNLIEGSVLFENANELSPHYLREKRGMVEDLLSLMQSLNSFSNLQGPYAANDKQYISDYHQLKKRELPALEIEEMLNQKYNLLDRLQSAGTLLKVLPGKDGEWYSLNALTLQQYNKKTESLVPITNFTLFSNDDFEKIQKIYSKLIFDYSNPELKETLAALLIHNYKAIAGTPIKKAWDKSISYPSSLKLQIENWYYEIPLIEAAITMYGVAILLLSIGLGQKKRRIKKMGTFFALVAFVLNGLILCVRCYILGRPPVSNMFETVIYVPWISVLVSLILSSRLKNYIIILGSCVVAIGLLVLLKLTGLGSSMENVQAVLDSQYWLIIHVLMVVGSYGVFALSGVLGQFYLWQYISHKHETYSMHELGHAILQSMYVGIALLIPGTLLGGIWAAQSWGRFWDWDPKESWAFISSCLYVLFIHAYTFKYIGFFGLAMGAVLGLLAISFTWYGVNYILGTGLHSYGFGSGGEIYYYLFIAVELFFLFWASLIYFQSTRNSFERK